MDARQRWNRIVDLHKQYYKTPETTIQNVWENICVEILGFSRLEGEVERHRSIYLGSTERVIPDIIVKDSSKDLFVIELKLHNAIFEDSMRRQLFSYLKQLKVNVGVLVCEKLYIYSYDYSKQDSEQLFVEIPFEKDLPEGIKFVDIFNKKEFAEELVHKYAYDKNKFALNMREISEQLTVEFLYSLVRDHFSRTYSDEEIEAVLGNTLIQICEKTVAAEPEMPVVDPPIYTVDKMDKMDKEKAYFLLRKNLVSITKPFTYASLNKNGAIYWANPSTAVLKKDWWIVLNDSKKGELHYLMVPKNQFTEKDFKIRKDKNAIDFQVTYGSKNFFDSRSQISFVQFHKGTIKY